MPELSPEILQRLRERAAPPPPPRPRLPWLQLSLVFFALGAIGWGCYQHWRYRLPQDRDITMQNGKSFHGTLLAHNDKFLALTLTDSGQIRFLPLSALVAVDRDFIQHTQQDLTLKFPLEYVLTDPSGKELAIRLEARTSAWVKVTNLATQAQTLLSIDALSPEDQDFVRQMPTTLSLLFPLEYIFTGPPAPGVNVRLLGRTPNYVKYQTGANGSKEFAPIASLSEVDRALLRQLPNSLPKDYPVAVPLTTAEGGTLPGLIFNHNFDLVALKVPEENAVRYFPIKRLSAESQRFIHELAGDLIFACPLDCVITNAQGKSVQVRVLARAQEFLKLSGDAGVLERYLPLAELSDPDQQVFRTLPVTFTLQYPFNYVLTDLTGRTLNVQVLGRTENEVRFQLANGSIQTYALSKLISINQEFLRLLPVSSSSAESSAQLGYPPEASIYRNQIATLSAENEQLRAHLDNPTTPIKQKALDKQKIDDNAVQISTANFKLDALLKNIPAKSAP